MRSMQVKKGLDPTDMLQKRIVALEARKLADGATGAAEANVLRGMVQQYRTLLESSIDSRHLSPEWLAAVSNLRAAERGGDLGASDEARQWLDLLTSLDGRGADKLSDKLSADDFADGTLIMKVYADEIAVLDGRLPASLDSSEHGGSSGSPISAPLTISRTVLAKNFGIRIRRPTSRCLVYDLAWIDFQRYIDEAVTIFEEGRGPDRYTSSSGSPSSTERRRPATVTPPRQGWPSCAPW